MGFHSLKITELPELFMNLRGLWSVSPIMGSCWIINHFCVDGMLASAGRKMNLQATLLPETKLLPILQGFFTGQQYCIDYWSHDFTFFLSKRRISNFANETFDSIDYNLESKVFLDLLGKSYNAWVDFHILKLFWGLFRSPEGGQS